jgi:TIR domain
MSNTLARNYFLPTDVSTDTLRLTIVWHPSLASGPALAMALADAFDKLGMTRDNMRLNVPVRIRTTPVPSPDRPLRSIDWEKAEINGVIVFSNAGLVRAARRGWSAFFQDIKERRRAAGGRLFVMTIAADTVGRGFCLEDEEHVDRNFVGKLSQPTEGTLRRLQIRMLAAVGQHFKAACHGPMSLGNQQAPEVVFTVQQAPEVVFTVRQAPEVVFTIQQVPEVVFTSQQVPEVVFTSQQVPEVVFTSQQVPEVVFINHASKDGRDIAEWIDSYVRSTDLGVSTFIDSRNIPAGMNYRTAFEHSIAQSAFLSIQTDAWGSRPYCQWELMHAKRCRRPIIAVRRIRAGEDRAFPYAGNMPTHSLPPELEHNGHRRWLSHWRARTGRPPLELKETELIIRSICSEVLRCIIWERTAQRVLSRLKRQDAVVLPRPPELADLALIRTGRLRNMHLIVYPDPPVGNVERDLLDALRGDIEIKTLSEISEQIAA